MSTGSSTSTKREQQPAWHAMSQAEVEGAMPAESQGLTTAEAQTRLATYGPNKLPEEKPTSTLMLILRQLRSPLIIILIIAAIVMFLLEEYIDVGFILLVVVLNTIVGFTQEGKAEESVRALASMVSPRARVIRDGREQGLEVQELVPGDVALLESGIRGPRIFG